MLFHSISTVLLKYYKKYKNLTIWFLTKCFCRILSHFFNLLMFHHLDYLIMLAKILKKLSSIYWVTVQHSGQRVNAATIHCLQALSLQGPLKILPECSVDSSIKLWQAPWVRESKLHSFQNFQPCSSLSSMPSSYIFMLQHLLLLFFLTNNWSSSFLFTRSIKPAKYAELLPILKEWHF